MPVKSPRELALRKTVVPDRIHPDEHIDLGRDHSAWMARLKCTSEELSAAVGVVGPQALAVQIFIRGARTGGRTTATRGRRRRP